MATPTQLKAEPTLYQKKLKDPRWQKKRLDIFSQDDWTCKGCGSQDKTLHVHHFYYIHNADPWDYPNTALVTLCEHCHEHETRLRPLSEDKLLFTLKTLRITAMGLDIFSDAFSRFHGHKDWLYGLLWAMENPGVMDDLARQCGEANQLSS